MPAPEFIASYWTLAGPVLPRARNQASPFAFEDRVRAAAAAGYRGMGLMHDDLRAAAARMGLPAMRSLLADHGIVHLELEFLGDWFAAGSRRQASDRLRRELLHAAEVLGARHVKVGADSRGALWPQQQLADAFASLCADAARHGTRIALELLPWTQLATVEAALPVVRGAAAANGGLLLDIWHLVRAGVPLADVAALPVGCVVAAELNDASLHCQGSLWEDTIQRRKLCGQGSFDLRGFVAALRATGFHGPYGIEIISAEHRARPLDEAARLAIASARLQFPHAQLHPFP